jgi:nucleotide-binding universal stress UspA family protein
MTYHRHQLESPIGAPGVVDHDATRKASQALADEMVEQVLARVHDRPPAVKVTVIPGGAGHSLVAAGHSADLLVGTRRLGHVRGVLLGSVSRFCVHQSSSPVVVVPCRSEPAAAGGQGTEKAAARPRPSNIVV